jgi:hypothetical protein
MRSVMVATLAAILISTLVGYSSDEVGGDTPEPTETALTTTIEIADTATKEPVASDTLVPTATAGTGGGAGAGSGATEPPPPPPTATLPPPRPATPTSPPPPPCHPSYEGACLQQNIGDYDCAGGSVNGPNYTRPVRVGGPDKFDLDRDGDGYGCE